MNSILDGQQQAVEADPGLNILSVDLECWEQLVHRKLTNQLIPCSESLVRSTSFLLNLFREKDVRATFFVVGYVAEAFPELIRRINLEGHEIASHGYSHLTIDMLSPERFREEIRRSSSVLRSLTGDSVKGFRAPEFSLGPGTHWAMEILAQEGIEYDSSVVPCSGRKHGVAGFSRGSVRLTAGPYSILEVPPSTITVLGRNRLAAGGSYFRLLPYFLIKRIVRRVNRDGFPFVMYCHPYEFSSERLGLQDDVKSRSRLAATALEFKYNLFRKTMRYKLSRLLDEFRFAPFREVLAHALRK
ncbi:MAG: polysaccharide deacetylase family protein [Desulfomonile tiedjei]|uniref:Polysaccharide deacetylase family protein n=1 Tax=Desulfomonile tiedjei TaxID=2358 RepID=A0A9D6V4P2_9BACT|nr:polysaccharide deacetylase family protein [Desulfomonile tiedjei]